MTPTFSDIASLLDTLINKDPHIDDGSPHAAFWRGTSEADFINIKTDDWGYDGNLVAPGDPNSSPLYLALAGNRPFDGSEFQQMPDKTRAHMARLATPEELNIVRTWILNLKR